MKFKVNYALKMLVRENYLYLISFLLLNSILIFMLFFYLGKYNKNSEKVNILVTDINELNKKKELLDFKNEAIKNEVDLDYVNSVLTMLIPSQEDYFSIIAALEKLSLETGFLITSYTINIQKSSEEKLSLVIEGQGDPDAFLRFLQEYNFSGGRLITIDKINFSQEDFSGSKINISVYTRKNSGSNLSKADNIDVNLIEKILEKVNFEIKNDEEFDFDYPTKPNPF